MDHTLPRSMYARATPSQLAVSVVVPCYNSEQCLRGSSGGPAPPCREIFREKFEIVLVDDVSKDGTWPLVSDLAKENPHTAYGIDRLPGLVDFLPSNYVETVTVGLYRLWIRR